MTELLDFAKLIARAAGSVLRERYGQPREIHAKGWRDIYTDADLAAQKTIVDLIRSRDPTAAILAEEGITPPDGARLIWVIDPLDGTTNYARRIPTFCTSIGVVQDSRPIAGAIYDPLHDYLFAAEIDRGATLNGMPLHASGTSHIAEAIIGLDWGRGEKARAIELEWVRAVGTQCRTMRAAGSAALGLCYLAAGWIDVYYHGALSPWDSAAGQLIAQEAGVKLFNFDRKPFNYTDPTCLACGPQLVEWALGSLG